MDCAPLDVHRTRFPIKPRSLVRMRYRCGRHLFFYYAGNDPDRMLQAGRAMNGIWPLGVGILVSFGPVICLATFGLAGDYAVDHVPSLPCARIFVDLGRCAAFFFLAVVTSLWGALHRLTWFSLSPVRDSGRWNVFVQYSGPIAVIIGLVIGGVRLGGKRPWTIEWGDRQKVLITRWSQALGMLLMIACLVLSTSLAIWTAYGFRYSAMNTKTAGAGEWRTSWDSISERKGWVVETVKTAKEYRLLPEAYLYGFLYTYHNSQQRTAFLLGEHRQTGWRWFFPFCELVKTPTAPSDGDARGTSRNDATRKGIVLAAIPFCSVGSIGLPLSGLSLRSTGRSPWQAISILAIAISFPPKAHS